jgi:hypothetical protein
LAAVETGRQELFVHAPGNGAFVDAILSVTVDGGGAAFEASAPKAIVRTVGLNLPHSGGDYHTYDVSPDGQRFLVLEFFNQLAAQTTTGSSSPDPPFGLVAALNWTSTLEK